MYTEKFFWKVYVFRTSATWLLWTYGGWLLGGCPSWSQCNCQCVYLEWTRYILHNFEWNKYQHPLLSYHFSSLYNLIGVASFEELSKTCCHLQEHIKWQKIDNRWCLCWSHIHQQCQSQPTCKKKLTILSCFHGQTREQLPTNWSGFVELVPAGHWTSIQCWMPPSTSAVQRVATLSVGA